jgi:trimethyllysine dioxygenase
MVCVKTIDVDESKGSVIVEWDDGNTSQFHSIWLRDNCHCAQCFYPATKQRLLNSATIPSNILPLSWKITNNGKSVVFVWNDKEHSSEYDGDWLYLHAYNPRVVPLDQKLVGEKDILAQQFWKVSDMENNLPKVDFNSVMAATESNQEAIKDWCMKIWKYGFCLIDNVPVTPEDTQKLCEKLDYIRPTHYGGFWDFTSDLSKADTAYTNIDISNHTDGTYWSDTPGLQLFHLLYHDGTGGTTSLVDAFRCAQIMKEKYPESYDVFTRIPIPAHSAGEETVCIQPDIPQPIFKLDLQGNLIQVRWNQSDRSTMDNWKDPNDIPKFYEAIKIWVSLINDPENELFYQLKPGQCLIFDNWRVFHSRTEFTGKRRMCGAYHNRDDFVSKLKILALGRKAVLDFL